MYNSIVKSHFILTVLAHFPPILPQFFELIYNRLITVEKNKENSQSRYKASIKWSLTGEAPNHFALL